MYWYIPVYTVTYKYILVHTSTYQLHRHLARLPVSEAKKISAMTHTEAVEGGLLKTMSEDELKRFTPSKHLLNKIASEHRYISVHTSNFWTWLYIPVHTSMY